MLKKLFIMLLTVLVVLTSMSSIALANADKVEVEFCVGNETFMINGTAVVVEKPYVVGAGVTLVPLRVITEAFGAQVEWIGETKTINLTYPDVKIVLQIANPTAEINGRAEEILAAPELTSNGYTMVPLRFISENFGATVSYDEAAQRITVVKEAEEIVDTVITVNKCTLKIPADFKETQSSLTAFSYEKGDIFFGVNTSTGVKKYEDKDIEEIGGRLAGEQALIDGKTHENIQYLVFGDKYYVVVTVRSEGNTAVHYTENYYAIHDYDAYFFTAIYAESAYSENGRKEIRDILSSAKYE